MAAEGCSVSLLVVGFLQIVDCLLKRSRDGFNNRI